MRFWSEGLGDRQLVMSLGKAKMERQGEIILVSGIVDSPAPWEFEVKIKREDWESILKTAVTKDACGFLARKASLPLLIRLGAFIARFIVLLGWYRLLRMFGAGRASAGPADADPAPVPANARVAKK